MIKYNTVVCCYGNVLVNVAVYVIPVYSVPHTHTPNQELHMRQYLPTFYHNNTLLYCILLF